MSFPLRHLFILCLAAFQNPASAATNLFGNASFESGTWGGGQSFVDPNNATTLFNSNSTVTGWTTNIGSTWVQDSAHAVDANRMVWLGPPSVGASDCISQRLSVSAFGDPASQLVVGNRYDLTIDYSFFAPSDPTAFDPTLSRFQIYYLLGNDSTGDNPFTQTILLDNSGSVSAWDDGLGGSGLVWNFADIGFDMPDITGYDYMKIFISAPKSTAGNTSRGVLVDNAMLTLIPEPGSLMLCAFALLPSMRRRR